MTRIVLRGIGPSLTVFGVPNALANPTLELRNSNGALLLANDNWQDDPAQAAELTAAGLAPTNTSESGIAITLGPGLYTALLAGRRQQHRRRRRRSLRPRRGALAVAFTFGRVPGARTEPTAQLMGGTAVGVILSRA